MLMPTIAIPELLLRVTLVYLALLLLLRIVGKRHVGELAPFDLVVLLILSEGVQNALIADDKSITSGLIAATTLFALNYLIGYVSWRSKEAGRAIEGAPRVLVRNGEILKDTMPREQITHAELLEAMRREGCTSISRVRYAVLEPDGDITIGLRARRR